MKTSDMNLFKEHTYQFVQWNTAMSKSDPTMFFSLLCISNDTDFHWLHVCIANFLSCSKRDIIKFETTFKDIPKWNQKLGQVFLILSSALEGDRATCYYESYYDSFSDVQPDLALAHNLIENHLHKFLSQISAYKNPLIRFYRLQKWPQDNSMEADRQVPMHDTHPFPSIQSQAVTMFCRNNLFPTTNTLQKNTHLTLLFPWYVCVIVHVTKDHALMC